MAKTLCTTWLTRVIAIMAVIWMLALSVPYQQLWLIAVAGLFGALLSTQQQIAAYSTLRAPYNTRNGLGVLLIFTILLLLTFSQQALTSTSSFDSIAATFYQAGALVFGGGHVVLPLLSEATVQQGVISESEFFAGYGAAQALPGPLFSFAAFLGAQLSPDMPWSSALIATLAIFVPGFLLLGGLLPFWQRCMQHSRAFGMISGINAAVVGLLAATWLQPLALSISSIADWLIMLMGFVLLRFGKLPILAIMAMIVAVSINVSYY